MSTNELAEQLTYLSGGRCVTSSVLPSQDDLDVAFDAYLTTALWSSVDDNGEPLDANGRDAQRIPASVKASLRVDCDAFMRENAATIGNAANRDGFGNGGVWGQAGHDFWLTRNRHGAGFWDGDWNEGDKLTEACRKYGEVNLYMHRGWVYAYPNG